MTVMPAAPMTNVTTPANLVESSLTEVLIEDANVLIKAMPANANSKSVGTAKTKAANGAANRANRM